VTTCRGPLLGVVNFSFCRRHKKSRVRGYSTLTVMGLISHISQRPLSPTMSSSISTPTEPSTRQRRSSWFSSRPGGPRPSFSPLWGICQPRKVVEWVGVCDVVRGSSDRSCHPPKLTGGGISTQPLPNHPPKTRPRGGGCPRSRIPTPPIAGRFFNKWQEAKAPPRELLNTKFQNVPISAHVEVYGELLCTKGGGVW